MKVKDMVRLPDIESKTDRLTFVPKSQDDLVKVEAFKKLVIKDHPMTIYDLLNEAIDLVLAKHNVKWGGNPNQSILLFMEETKVTRCNCGKPAVKHGVNLRTNVERDFCLRCFSGLPMRYDVKQWSWRSIL